MKKSVSVPSLSDVQAFVNGIEYQIGTDFVETGSEYSQQFELLVETVEDIKREFSEAIANSGSTAQHLCRVVELGIGGFGTGGEKAVARSRTRPLYWNAAATGFNLTASDVVEFKYHIRASKPVNFVEVTIPVKDKPSNV